MKQPTAASLKRVNAENLTGLGVERLAAILLVVANSRPELKRQLRMELAATQGADHLALEVDKRLTSLETRRSKVSWRQRPTFLRDLEALRGLIAERMAELDQNVALDRMWRFMNLAGPVSHRVRDKHGDLDGLFLRAAADLNRLVCTAPTPKTAEAFVDAVSLNPKVWRDWLPVILQDVPKTFAASSLSGLVGVETPIQADLLRQLADVAGDVEAYRATYSAGALLEPRAAAEVANRLMTAGRLAEAGEVLDAAGADVERRDRSQKRPLPVDEDWEVAGIRYLELTGELAAAQAARWASFEATLSVDQAKAFISRLADFDDVEAESRAFEYAARYPDFQRGLTFLMDWPAVAEAGRMIEARPDDIRVTLDQAERWAPKLQRTKPRAAYLLLRRAAADAFRRREFATCDRLTLEAEAIELPQ
jgi:hypothetical protein